MFLFYSTLESQTARGEEKREALGKERQMKPSHLTFPSTGSTPKPGREDSSFDGKL